MEAVLQWGYISATQKTSVWPHLRKVLILRLWVNCPLDFLWKHFSNWSCLKFSFFGSSWAIRSFAFFHHNELFSSGRYKTSTKCELSDVGLVKRHRWDFSPKVLPCCLHPFSLPWELLAQLCSLSCQSYFTLFRSEHLLGLKEWPDHVVIKILTRGLDLYI